MALDLLALDRVIDPRAVDRRDGRAGADPVDANPAPGVLERQRARQVLHPALADRVAQVIGLRDQLVDARDVDDHARLVLGEEVADRLASAQEGAAEVDRKHLVEVIARELVAVTRDLDAGVVDEDVEATELTDGVVDHRHDVGFAGDVALNEHVAHALLLHSIHARLNLLLGLAGLAGLVQIVDRDVRAVLRELDRDCLADSGRAARDQNALALQPGHRLGPSGTGGGY